MKTPALWPVCLPGWLRYLGVWVLLMAVCAPQTKWSGAARSWSEVAWIQVSYWSSWAVLTLPIFHLCQRLYEGPRRWRRYVFGLLLGAIGVALLHPVIENLIRFGREWLQWSFSTGAARPGGFLAKTGSSVLNGSGTNPFMFAVIVCVWHAMRYAGDLRERQVNALEMEARLRTAELQALRSQLHPHFLFNTLHSIAELVHANPDLAEQLILRLGELLRKVLDTSGRQEIPLAEEIEFIRAYLDIEQMRLGDRLRVEWSIATDTLGIPVPSLILQPLVENAIRHGITSTKQPGEVRLNARRENGFLHLEVCDNGPGLSRSGPTVESGIGLSNTEARLRAIYGDRHRIELINGHGLSVNICLPVSAPPAPARSPS